MMSIALRIPVFMSVTLFVLWLAGLVAFAVHIKGTPVPDKVRTDAIVVLTGGPDRINTGLDLLAEKQADYLFISGVNTEVSVEQLVALWRKDIRNPPCCVALGHIAKNTFENAAEARDWIVANEIRSVRLLTADYHMPRAKLEFMAVLPDMDIHPHPIRTAQNNRILIFQEYNKTLFTAFRLIFHKEQA